MFILNSIAICLSVRLRTKWLWVRIPLLRVNGFAQIRFMVAANFGGNPLLEANFLLVFLFLSFLDTKKNTQNYDIHDFNFWSNFNNSFCFFKSGELTLITTPHVILLQLCNYFCKKFYDFVNLK